MTRGARPPAAAEALLRAALGPGPGGDAILGDLHEEFVARLPGARAARAWYWRQAATLGIRLGARRAYRALARQRPRTGDAVMPALAAEARLALRTLVKRPALTGLVVLTLGVALGANVAIFGMIDVLVLRPFTIREADRVVTIAEVSPQEIFRRGTVAPANFLDWRREADAFSHLAAFDFWDVNLVGRDEPERIQGSYVSHGFFPALGVVPALGRGFVPDDETWGRHRVVVVGHDLWQRRFGADPDLVGQAIVVDGEPHEVVGIAPRGFEFPMGAEAWAPLAFEDPAAASRTAHYLSVVGRLRPGRTLDEADAQMAVIADRLARDHPGENRDRGVRVMTLEEGMMDEGLGPVLSLWQASAAFVLLIACANIANLLLARGAERQRETAVRLALGASRARLVRERLVESLLLGLGAVPVALAVAWASLQLVRLGMPAEIAKFVAGWERLGIDARIAGVAVVAGVVIAVLSGLVPALHASRPRIAETLRDGGRGATPGAGRQRLRRLLVAGEVALALPLLVAAGMSASGTHRFLNGPQGYDPDGVLAMKMVLPDARYGDPAARRRFADEILAGMTVQPGVESAAVSTVLPAGRQNNTRGIEVEGVPPPEPGSRPQVEYRAVTPGYFRTLRIPLVEGRAFTGADHESAVPVAIVSSSMARRFWPGESAVGRRFRIGADGPWLTVVGVSGDVIHHWFASRHSPTLHVPWAQAPAGRLSVAVRTAGDPLSIAPGARDVVRRLDAQQPVFELRPLRAWLGDTTIGLRYVAAIMAVFAVLALVLAMTGVYAVMAFLVAQRTHEIGVRVALGATPSDVRRLALGQALRVTAGGLAAGLLLSVGVGRLMEAGLFGVMSADVRWLAGFAAVLMAAALAAGYLPARRASAVDPLRALRAD